LDNKVLIYHWCTVQTWRLSCGLSDCTIFSIRYHKSHFKKHIEHEMCVLILSTKSLTYILLQGKFRKVLLWMYIGLLVKHPFILSGATETCIFSTHFRKFLQCKISWKFVQWESICSVQTCRQTNTHNEANSCFSQFYERARKLWFEDYCIYKWFWTSNFNSL